MFYYFSILEKYKQIQRLYVVPRSAGVYELSWL